MLPKINPITGRPVSKQTKRHDGPKAVTPAELFLEVLKTSTQFTNMPGKCKFLDTDIRPKSEWWKFTDPIVDGGGALLQIPEDSCRNTLVHLKCIWVSPSMGQQGIGARAMEAIKSVRDEAYDLATNKELLESQGRYASYKCLTLTLVPNSFSAPERWSLDEDSEVDWCDYKSFEDGMMDETKLPLPKSKRRVSWYNLQKWYQKLGFEVCEGLKWNEGFDPNTGQMVYEPTMTRRSMLMNRPQMVYPAEDSKIYGKAPKDWIKRMFRDR